MRASIRKDITRKPMLAAAVAMALATGAFTNVAHAADDSLTWHGITFYGVFDVDLAYQSHGAPLSKTRAEGVNYLIAKNSNGSHTSIGPNGLSQSKLGLKGKEEFADGWYAVFNAELGFQPNSGQLTDGLKSL